MEKFVETLAFGKKLNELRKDKNLNATKLAAELGVRDTTILRWEKGLMFPNILHLYRIAVYFGVSADYLLGSDFLIKTLDKDNNEQYVAMTKEEILFIEELKKNKMVYDILLQDPKRGADLVKKEIG